jgi:uncharacterized membrane protein
MAGLADFVGIRDELVRIVPPSLPAPGLLVTITGVIELVGVAGLICKRTAALTAAALTTLMLAMFPANVYAAREGLTTATSDQLPYRAAMEVVFLAATIAVVVHERHTHAVARRYLARPGSRPAATTSTGAASADPAQPSDRSPAPVVSVRILVHHATNLGIVGVDSTCRGRPHRMTAPNDDLRSGAVEADRHGRVGTARGPRRRLGGFIGRGRMLHVVGLRPRDRS